MGAIKKREPLLRLWYRDINGGVNFILVPKKYKDQLFEALNTKKFVELEGVIIKADLVMKVEEYKVKSDLDEFVASLPLEARKALEIRNKEKYSKIGKYIESVEEARNYLAKKGFIK